MYIKKKKINNSTIFDKTIIYRLWLALKLHIVPLSFIAAVLVLEFHSRVDKS